jgi:hypothetical protein
MASARLSKRINLLIGKTGVGKSSLISSMACRQLYVSHNVCRGTVDPEIVDIDNWTILDTRGLSDPQEEQRDEAIINLKKYLFENKHELSSIILYIHDPVDAKRVEGDIVRALQLLKRAVKDSHLDNLVLLYRVTDRNRNPKMYLKALGEWKKIADELDCQVRESIPIYATRDWNDETDTEVIKLENVDEVKSKLLKHRYERYFEWRQKSCSKCGKLGYVEFDLGPCHYHLGTARSHVGVKEYYHSGNLEIYHPGTWSPGGSCSSEGPWQCCNNSSRHSGGCQHRYTCCKQRSTSQGCQERCDRCKKHWSAQCDGFCEKCNGDTNNSVGCIREEKHNY